MSTAWLLLQGLVRPVGVLVPGVFGQDLAKMPLAEPGLCC